MTRLFGLTVALAGCGSLFDSDTDTGSPFPIDTGEEETDDTATTSACPAGTARATGGSFSADVATFQAQTVTLDLASSDHQGQAPVCASPDGLRARWLLASGGRPTMFLTLNASNYGSQDPRGGGVVLDGIGLSPPTTWSGDDVYAGTWGVSPQGGGTSHGVYLEAETQGRTFILRAEALVVP